MGLLVACVGGAVGAAIICVVSVVRIIGIVPSPPTPPGVWVSIKGEPRTEKTTTKEMAPTTTVEAARMKAARMKAAMET